ncbi:MAG: ABC transporter permease [Bryobacteraceae bacterium]
MGLLKHAFRRLAKAPLATAIAIATLALAIGVNSAVFSVMDGFLLRALPYPRPDRLAALVVHREGIDPVRGIAVSDDDDSFDGDDWQLFKTNLDALALASWGGSGGVNLIAGGAIRYVTGSRVSAGYFDVLGIPPYLGRGFSAEEDRPHGPPAAVLSYALWQSTFHSDPKVVGQSIQLKGERHTVVGVLPRNALTPNHADVFTPLQPAPTGECGGQNCGILVRLKPNATWAQVTAQLSRIRLAYFSELETRYHGRARIYARPLQLELAGDMRGKVIVLMFAVGFILLIACANLAGLALVRLLRRKQEIATRFALGALRLDVLRELWMEDLIVAFIGGVGGTGFALFILKSLQYVLPESMIPVGNFSIDTRVLAFTLGASLLASILCGALPALQIRRFYLGSSSFAGSRAVTSGSNRLRQVLIAAQVALTVVLLISAGLLVRTLIHLETLPPGFDPHNVMTATASLDDARYHDAGAFQKLLEESVAAMRQIPGVRDAAVGLSVPYERGLNDGIAIPDGKRAGTRSASSVAYATPGYFSTLRIPLLAGRAIGESDSPTSERVAIVNLAFARRFFDSPSPLGYHFKTGGITFAIVGIVGDVAKQQGIERTAPIGTEPVAYLPASQAPQGLVNIAHIWFQPSWIVLTNGPIQGLNASMQRALADADPSLPFSGFRSMDQILAEHLQLQRTEVLLLATLASLALLLSAIGIYGLVSNLVVQRTREIGIRIALGSTVWQAVLRVGSTGVVAAAGGLVSGVVLAFLATRILSSQIYGVSTHDPATFIDIGFILAVTAGAASFLPALRISRIQPADTLRAE